MENKTFETLLRAAIAGSHDALEVIFEMYDPLINKHSQINGVFDEDCKQYILMRIAIQISKFEI